MKRRTLPPKPYPPLQTRTRHRRPHRPHAPTLMRANTPPTTRSPPHRPRPAGNPPIRQPATAGKEKRGGRGPTSRRTPTRAAPERRPPLTARHAPPPRPGTSDPGACAGPPRSATRPAAGPARAPPPPPPHTPRPPKGASNKGRGPWRCRLVPPGR
jgi:hypothetical protein